MSAGRRSTHRRTRHSRTPNAHRSKEMQEDEDRFSPESYLRSIAERQSQRLRVRRKWHGTVHNPKQPYLSLAERILIAKLDPENFSVQAVSAVLVSNTERHFVLNFVRERKGALLCLLHFKYYYDYY